MAIKPNFLIVGAAKSGTTSLYEYLKQHPEVFMPDWKEPSFFARETGIEKVGEYEQLFSGAGGKKAVGEASVAYLYDSAAPDNIMDYLGPQTKIIVILRNPIDMAYSLWGHMVRIGRETLPFLKALESEEHRMKDGTFKQQISSWLYNFAYTDRARYSKQVERYLNKFGRPQVKVYVFEEFFKLKDVYFRDLCKFLEINEDFTPEFRVHNTAGTVRSSALRKILNDASSLKEAVKRVVPAGLRQKIKKKINDMNRKNVPLPPLSTQEREKLWRLFEKDVSDLEVLLGRKLADIWRP